MARLVRLSGYEIYEANDSGTAMESAKKILPDVIVADIRLPDFDGFELCRRLKADKGTKKIPVLLVTSMYYQSANGTTSVAAGKKKAKDAGALDLFPRGEALDALRPLLDDLAKKKSGARKKKSRA